MSLCVCVCVSTSLSPEPHATIFTNFSVHVAYGCGSVLFQNPKERGNFGGCPGHLRAFAIFTAAIAAVFAAEEIIQSPIMSCSRRGHSVRQASTNRNLENSERRRCGLSHSLFVKWWTICHFFCYKISDYDKHYVTAFSPVGRARRNWSYKNT